MPALTSLVNPASAEIINGANNPVPVYDTNVDTDLQSIALTLDQIIGVLGFLTISTTGRLIVDVNNPTGGTIATVSSITNQTQVGGFNANDQIPVAMNTLYQSGIRNRLITT